MAYLPKHMAWRVSCILPYLGSARGGDGPPLANDPYAGTWHRTYLERHYRVLAQTLRRAAKGLVFSYSVSKRQTTQPRD